MKKSKAFTLIELIAVLVILAILALIVTPLVLNIIKKARTSADKRSIDAYGRSIELAIADYLLDKGEFPTSIDQLTIEYSGDKVECETTKLNFDSSVYLANCTVAGRTVSGYTYGEEAAPTYAAYSVGDKVSYNNVTYYVIEDSNTTNDTVKLLKENPLTKAEMDTLDLTDVTIEEENSYAKVQFGEVEDYNSSIVKHVVDEWGNTVIKKGDIAVARLISFEEIHNLGYDNEPIQEYGVKNYYKTELVPTWVYNSQYTYWTESVNQLKSNCYAVLDDGELTPRRIGTPGFYYTVRPVLEILKSATITKVN